MLSILLIIFSISIVFLGKFPLLGGNVLRGNKARYTGIAALFLSVFSLFTGSKYSIFVIVSTLIFLCFIYFFVKGENPSESEVQISSFSSAKEELKTYGDAAKGLIIFVIIIGMIVGILGVIMKLLFK